MGAGTAAATVAAYVSVGSEPGTGLLLDALAAAGKRVLLPVVLPGLDLDWAVYAGREGLAPAVRGLLEPTAPRLGREAIAQADVVLVPGPRSRCPARGSARAAGATTAPCPASPPAPPSPCVLYDDEVGLAVPAEPHDVRVGFALTSAGWRLCRDPRISGDSPLVGRYSPTSVIPGYPGITQSAGVSTRVSSAAACTASRVKAQGSVSPST